MTNIPTDLLRTLITVVDLRSFTKAAHSLGVTQPAVSAQVKRLQHLLGADVLDKSAPGVSLTATGELVVTYARRLLSINDQILHLGGPGVSARTLRIGLPEDFVDPSVVRTLSRFLGAWPNVRYRMRSAGSDALLRDLRDGDLDLAVALTTTGQAPAARHSWIEQLAWVRGPTLRLDPDGAVPLVLFDEESIYRRIAVCALNHAGRDTDLVLSASSLGALAAAVAAGLGVTVLTRHRFGSPQLIVCEDTPLPRLQPVYCGVYLGDRVDRGATEQLADALAVALQPPQAVAEKTAAAN